MVGMAVGMALAVAVAPTMAEDLVIVTDLVQAAAVTNHFATELVIPPAANQHRRSYCAFEMIAPSTTLVEIHLFSPPPLTSHQSKKLTTVCQEPDLTSKKRKRK